VQNAFALFQPNDAQIFALLEKKILCANEYDESNSSYTAFGHIVDFGMLLKQSRDHKCLSHFSNSQMSSVLVFLMVSSL
jgi:hypothetical protein